MNNADDDEPFSFQPLAAITARLLQGSAPKNEERHADRADEQEGERSEEFQRQYIEQRLRDLAALGADRARGSGRR